MSAPAPNGGGGSAPSYNVPQERIVSIEHPCIVKNFSNGFKSLGGEHHLKQVLEHEVHKSKDASSKSVDPVAGVSLRPDDPFAKRLSSIASPTHNVLIKVTVPKRTGRKRKRGSDEPFTPSNNTSSHSDSITATELLQRLRDNEDRYSIKAVGVIQDTHRFPALPDFQVHSSDIPVMRELRDHAMEPNYERMKAFSMNFNTEPDGSVSIPGPPSFVRSAGLTESFEQKELRPQRAEPTKSQPPPSRRESAYAGKSFAEQSISLETDDLPTRPPEGLPRQMGGLVDPAMKALQAVFRERPIVSVRAFDCLQPGHTRNSLRAAIPHVGYYMNSGPWAHCIAMYGVDPRKDAAMRKYQSIRISYKGMSTSSIPNSRRNDRSKAHVFDGARIAIVTGIWQLCDLTDSTLQHVVDTDEVRAECELEQFGWYRNGTIAKIRVMLRDKMLRLVNDEEPLPEEDYLALADLEDDIKDTVGYGARVYKEHGHLQAMCSAIARDAVYRVREAAADKKSTASGEAGEMFEGVIYRQDGDEDDEDYAED